MNILSLFKNITKNIDNIVSKGKSIIQILFKKSKKFFLSSLSKSFFSINFITSNHFSFIIFCFYLLSVLIFYLINKSNFLTYFLRFYI